MKISNLHFQILRFVPCPEYVNYSIPPKTGRLLLFRYNQVEQHTLFLSCTIVMLFKMKIHSNTLLDLMCTLLDR